MLFTVYILLLCHARKRRRGSENSSNFDAIDEEQGTSSERREAQLGDDHVVVFVGVSINVKCLELFTYCVFSVGIDQYFLGIYQNRTNRAED
jgi:hypothetical protein